MKCTTGPCAVAEQVVNSIDRHMLSVVRIMQNAFYMIFVYFREELAWKRMHNRSESANLHRYDFSANHLDELFVTNPTSCGPQYSTYSYSALLQTISSIHFKIASTNWLLEIHVLRDTIPRSKQILHQTQVQVISPIPAQKLFFNPIIVYRGLQNVVESRQDSHCDASLR